MIEAGWYYDPAHSGWGLNVVKTGEASVVVTLYFNSPFDGDPVWLQATGGIGSRLDVMKHVGTAFPGVARATRQIPVGTLLLGALGTEGDLHVDLTLDPQGFLSGTQFSPPPPQIVWSGWLTKIG